MDATITTEDRAAAQREADQTAADALEARTAEIAAERTAAERTEASIVRAIARMAACDEQLVELADEAAAARAVVVSSLVALIGTYATLAAVDARVSEVAHRHSDSRHYIPIERQPPIWSRSSRRGLADELRDALDAAGYGRDQRWHALQYLAAQVAALPFAV